MSEIFDPDYPLRARACRNKRRLRRPAVLLVCSGARFTARQYRQNPTKALTKLQNLTDTTDSC
jgi:hypothetical protein